MALTTAILNHRWQVENADRQLLQEHVKQLRQERRETYAHYWSTWNHLNHHLEVLRDEVRELGTPPDAMEQLARQAPELIEQGRTAELAWREGVDGLLLIGGQRVAEAARDHMEATWQKVDAAWRGESYPTTDIYQRLNDAMRSELIDPARQ